MNQVVFFLSYQIHLEQVSVYNTNRRSGHRTALTVEECPETKWSNLMIQMKKILCPVDFSENAEHALKYAASFADKFDAELHLVHVLQDFVAMVPEPGLAYPPPGNFMEEMLEAAEKHMARLPESIGIEIPNVVRETRQGPPFLEIIRYAKENDIDMIVMGTHGRSGLVHMLLGSTAEKVVRKSPCPVLTIRPGEHGFVHP